MGANNQFQEGTVNWSDEKKKQLATDEQSVFDAWSTMLFLADKWQKVGIPSQQIISLLMAEYNLTKK